MSHFPLPHILNTLAQVLRGEGAGVEERASQDQLEELLPHLCLALPSYSITCANLLRSLPSDSRVWSQLEEALISKKILYPEITSVLYLLHRPALERELMRVLGLYAVKESPGPWWDEEVLTIAHFRPHGTLLCANPEAKEGQSCGGQVKRRKVNEWESSPSAEASRYDEQLFHQCLAFLGSVLVKTRFSFPAVVASRDYLSQVSSVMEDELYQSFPSDLSHLAYLLSLPLAMGQEQDALTDSTLLLIENALREELAEGGEATREKVCVMLSLFPFWLPLLRESGFLKGHLADSACDIFCCVRQGCR